MSDAENNEKAKDIMPTEFEAAFGRTTKTGPVGAVIGATAGAIIGAGVGALAKKPLNGAGIEYAKSIGAAAGGVLGVGIGGFTGTVVGARQAGDSVRRTRDTIQNLTAENASLAAQLDQQKSFVKMLADKEAAAKAPEGHNR